MLYTLRVIQGKTLPSNIKLEASTQLEARTQAEAQGYRVLRIQRSYRSVFTRNTFPITIFCQEFQVLLNAGLSLPSLLETLIEKEQNASNRHTLQQLLKHVSAGQTLSVAMAKNPDAFPSLLVATVAAAETTGNLGEALGRYSDYLENINLLKKRLISASVYPAVVLGFAFLVFVFLLVFVIPKFTKIYEAQVKSVSATTEFLLSLGHFSQNYGAHFLVVLGLVVLFFILLISKYEFKSLLVNFLWKTPYLGEKLHTYFLTRFYRTFSMLISSGISVSKGLDMVQALLGTGLKHHFHHAKQLISEGKAFSEALATSSLTTPVALRLIKVGEKTGTLSLMLAQAASFHEEEMTRWIDHFTKIFEPVLMAIIGVLIGGIVLMMYLPIFQLASGLG